MEIIESKCKISTLENIKNINIRKYKKYQH